MRAYYLPHRPCTTQGRQHDSSTYRLRNANARELVARGGGSLRRRVAALPVRHRRADARSRRRAWPKQRTIVLVHGYLANRSTLLPLRAYLKLRGLGPVLTFDYASSGGIEHGGAGAARVLQARTCAAAASTSSATRSAASWRAAGCRSWAARVASIAASRCRRRIAAPTAPIGWRRASAASCGPTRRSSQRLEATRAAAARVKFTSIVAGSDNIVFPRVFAAHTVRGALAAGALPRRRARARPGRRPRRHAVFAARLARRRRSPIA